MDKTETLMACPFCGGAPHLEHYEHLYSSGQNCWTVLCAQCGCEMGGADCPTEAEAIAAWNKRTPRPDNALADELERLYVAWSKPESETSAAFALRSHLVAHVPEILTALRTGCPSCHGLNTSCPDGCGRDQKTGELNGTRLEAHKSEALADDAVVRAVETAMRESWDDICSDTGCHPLDIYREGRKLFYKPNHWTREIAMHLRAAPRHNETSHVLLREARNILVNSGAESGYCMCGDPVASHTIGSGHSPVDAHMYMAEKLIARIDAALKEAKDAR